MSRWAIFWRLIGRPLVADPLRTALTVAAISLGVAVVVAIDLAGEASVGSFRSSMESLTGEADYEFSAVGGLDETLLGELVGLPYDLRWSPRVEGYATDVETGRTAALFGLDLIGDQTLVEGAPQGTFRLDDVDAETSVFVGRNLAEQAGERLRLRINDRSREYTVKGVLEGDGFAGLSVEDVVVMDIAAAQRALSKLGRLDRIQVQVPDRGGEDWQAILAAAAPPGVQLEPAGTRVEENRKMLGAFRWNLRVLSYLSLIVGAFLIYNTVAVSVVRRRSEIGVLRALGATRNFVRWAFLAEAGLLGALGALMGLAAGRLLATGAVKAMSLTVETLYVSSDPGELRVGAAQIVAAAAAGIGVALLSALQPASEAASVPPTEAMARGRRDHQSRLRVGRDLGWAAALGALAGAASLGPPVAGKPLFGYLATALLLAASALAVPAVVRAAVKAGSGAAMKLAGIEGFLGLRSIGAALSRTSILVAALSTATAMMVSIAILVGSFRETLVVWLDYQIRADLYIRAAGEPAMDRFPTLAEEVADVIERLPGVAAVDRFRAYRISYNGMPATLGGGDVRIHSERSGLRFLDGDVERVRQLVPTGDYAVVSEPFARKHDVWAGDVIRLDIAAGEAELEVVGVFYDYSSERGSVIVDRGTLLKYAPDRDLSSVAVYLEPGVDPEQARERVIAATAGRELYVATNARLRREATAIFDRTFAITYALEVVAIAVAILGMAGALFALVIDRKRELAVLRFLGGSQGQVRKLILTESGLLGLLSIGVGSALGSALSLVLIYVINEQSFGWTIQFHWPVGLLLGALGLIYVSSVAAGVYPARMAVRMDAAEGVRAE